MGTPGLSEMISQADSYMYTNEPEKALSLYKEAIPQAMIESSEVDRIWLLLSTANAAVRCGNSQQSQDALGKAYSLVHTGIVVGNPFFHLLVGLTYHITGQNPQAKKDNLVRALLCGGPPMFNGEDQEHLESILSATQPPDGRDSWDGFEGVARDSLNGAKGYVASLIEERYGQPLPYAFEEEEDDDYSDSDESGDEDDDEDMDM